MRQKCRQRRECRQKARDNNLELQLKYSKRSKDFLIPNWINKNWPNERSRNRDDEDSQWKSTP